MISYIGGKSRMAKWIGEFIPECETYVEVFGGAFWVYVNGNINEKPELKEVVYNDKNRYMANLFSCFRNPERMLIELNKYESQDKMLFNMFQNGLNSLADSKTKFNLNDYDLATKYAYCATQVFSGSKILESKFIDLKGKYVSKYDALKRKLQKDSIIEKMNKITKVENLDYTDLILKYDSPTTFFYVDPPYWKTENYYSNHDFDSEDHNTLITHLKLIKGKFALSYYDFPLLSYWLPKNEYKWEEREFSKAAGATKGKKQNKGTELLIMNY
tara:strand:- start:2075 stop:2890 length:816 start_codon:yes stop_codon:yes gene_type:complete